MELAEELDWLKVELQKQSIDNEICQCQTQRATSRSSDQGRFIAALFSYAFLDQLIYSRFLDIHRKFKAEFPGPKLAAHGSGGHAHPCWVLNKKGIGDIEIEWGRVVEICARTLSSGLQWIESNHQPPSGLARESFMQELGGEIAWHAPQEFSELKARISTHSNNSLQARRP